MSFGKMPLNRMTFSKMTLNRMTLFKMTLSRAKFSVTSYSQTLDQRKNILQRQRFELFLTERRHDIQHNTQHNDTEQNDNQHNNISMQHSALQQSA
jgi:hypothetical protein